MPTGYTRQRLSDMQDARTIAAIIFNDEFNLIQGAFNAVTGHNHDGTTGGGAPISLSSVTGTLPVTKGGTGLSTITANGILYGAGTGNVVVTAAGSEGMVLRAGAAGVPGFGAVNLASAVAVAGNLPVTNGGTGANNAITARANLGVFDIANRKSNLAAITDPTSVNDSGQDYGIGSVWINTATDHAFMCMDATPGAAVWKQFTN